MAILHKGREEVRNKNSIHEVTLWLLEQSRTGRYVVGTNKVIVWEHMFASFWHDKVKGELGSFGTNVVDRVKPIRTKSILHLDPV